MSERNKPSSIEEHYTVDEVAGLLRVSPATVWRKIELGKETRGKEGIYPTRKLGHRIVRIPASAVNRYLGGSNSTI
jgi:predicted DNA-binding transcriptional regulator AlpA